MTVALVALGAVACDDKIEEEDVTPTVVDKISFTASVEDMTRTYLQQDGEIYHTKWVGDEQLCVHTIDNYSEKFYFSNSKSKPNSFYCEAEGVGKLLNQKVVITYVKDIVSIDSDTYTIDSSAGATGVLLTANTTLTEDAQITMRAECAYLLYSSSAEVTFTAKQTGGERNLFAKGGVGVSTITLPGGNGIFVPIAAYDKAEGNAAYELSYSIGGAEGKSTTITPEWNKIYDLGVLTPTETPDVPTPSATSVYLVPGVWNVDDAWFAAYFFDANGGNCWLKLEDANTDGIFECKVPVDMTSVIFCRMNPAFADCGWNSGDEESTGAPKRVWNQTGDNTVGVAPANYFYMINWESGEWHEAGYTLPETPDTPGTPDLTDAVIYLVPNADWKSDSAWFAAHFYNETDGYADVKMEDADGDGIYECKVPAAMTNVLFCRMNPAYETFGWNSETENDHVWNQTEGTAVGVTPNNYFYITDWGKGEWHEAGYTVPETPDTPGTPDLTDAVIYLVPNADWKSDSAWFAAHFYNETDGYADVKMEDADGDGIYECKVPAAMTNVLFCRMNPAYETFGWNSETENDHVWNQTEGSAVGVTPNNYFYITDWGKGEWHEAGYTVPETPVAPADYAVAGSFSEWEDIPMETVGDNLFVAKNIKMEDYAAFKIKSVGSWDINYGAGDVVYLIPNHHIVVIASGGSDISVTKGGEYDVYFNLTELLVYVVTTGSSYTSAPLQTENGPEPEYVQPDVTDEVLYLKPNSNWLVDNARFAAYFFNAAGNTWVSATDSDGDGIYEVNIPTGYTFGDNVIFCRMNPKTTANNWNNKWNQTEDLVIPTDGNNLYTIKDGTWDKGGGTWSKK